MKTLITANSQQLSSSFHPGYAPLCLPTSYQYKTFREELLRNNIHLILILECQSNSYTSLTDGRRKTTYVTTTVYCDDSLLGWYRFEGDAGTRMPTTCPPVNRCGTSATGWLNGTHPTVAEGNVTREVCFSWTGNCCWQSTNIQVRNCGSYFVYNINGLPRCNMAYCGID